MTHYTVDDLLIKSLITEKLGVLQCIATCTELLQVTQ